MTPAASDLVSRQLGSGLWPLLRKADAAGGGAAGDVATSAQAVLALKPRQASYANDFNEATTALRTAAPTRASDRALRLLALLGGGAPPRPRRRGLHGLGRLPDRLC